MNIIIAGDSEVAMHLARLLSVEKHDITLISPSSEILRNVEANTDLLTVHGDSTSMGTLKKAYVKRADLLISAHLDGRVNLLTAILAKRLGARKCIAKVNELEYLGEECRTHYKSLGIDYLVSPEQIAAREISNLLQNTAATEIFDFSNKQLSIMLIKLEEGAPVLGKTLEELSKEYTKLDFRAVAIQRKSNTLIPRGDHKFMKDDLAYVITKPGGIEQLFHLGGKKPFEIRNVMIVGGGAIGSMSAFSLEKRFSIKLIEMNQQRCEELSDMLGSTLVINGDARDISLLEDESIGSMDAFVSVTNNSETNILTCLLARKYGVKKTIALVENLDFIDISQTIGIDTIINKKLATASYIVRFTMTANVISSKCLAWTEAEVFEFLAKPGSPITKRPINKSKFPDKAIIGGYIRNNQGFIATGDTQIMANDKVVVFALPQAFQATDRMFKA